MLGSIQVPCVPSSFRPLDNCNRSEAGRKPTSKRRPWKWAQTEASKRAVCADPLARSLGFSQQFGGSGADWGGVGAAAAASCAPWCWWLHACGAGYCAAAAAERAGVLGGSGSGTRGGIGRQRRRYERGYLGGSGSGTSGGRDLCAAAVQLRRKARDFATYIRLFVRVI